MIFTAFRKLSKCIDKQWHESYNYMIENRAFNGAFEIIIIM